MEYETVDIVASGYEYVCLKCDTLNCLSAYPRANQNGDVLVTCQNCKEQYAVDLPEHAYD